MTERADVVVTFQVRIPEVIVRISVRASANLQSLQAIARIIQ
jgi:hypothetical protein